MVAKMFLSVENDTKNRLHRPFKDKTGGWENPTTDSTGKLRWKGEPLQTEGI